MSVIVVTPPSAFMTPADIPGSHAANDASVQAWIDAAVSELDGPNGWLGLAIGPQTLEYRLDGFSGPTDEIKLPCGPIISVTSVIYIDDAGVATTINSADYQLLQRDGRLIPASGKFWPSATSQTGAVRILYNAGFNGTAVSSNGTGSIPTRIKQAIVLLTLMYKNTALANLSISEETVEGVGSRKFVVSEAAGRIYRDRVNSLVAPLRDFW